MQKRELDHLADDLRKILGFTQVGPARWQNVVLASRRAWEWSSTEMPTRTDERGGSSSPREIGERLEDRQVARRANVYVDELPSLVNRLEGELTVAAALGAPTPELAKIAERLARIVNWLTATVDHDKLPKTADLECISCARTATINGRKYQGHPHVPVYDKAVKHSLCRWCYDHQRAIGALPPIDVIDIYHRVGARAAGIELAKRMRT